MSRAEPFTADHPSTTAKTHVVAPEDAVRYALEPRMAALYDHLRIFAKRMNADPPKVGVDYCIPAFGILRPGWAEQFAVSADNPDRPTRVKLDFVYRGGESLSVIPESSERFLELRECLRRNKLEFSGATAGNLGKIVCKPKIPVGARFEAIFATGRIRLRLRNLGTLGISELMLEPNRVDVPLISEFEKLVLGERSEFHRLTGNAVSDSVLEDLRETLRRSKQRRMR